MQKGKGSTASPPAVVLTGRSTQSAPRGVPTSQPRPEEFSQRPGQGYQNMPGLPQAMVMTPGSFHGQLQTQAQPRLANQQSYYQGRPMRIPRGPPPTTPMYSSPPGGHMIPMIPSGGPFIHQQQNPQFIPPPVEFGQIPMTGHPPVQYRPQQPIPSQFPPVSGPSQPQGHFGYPGQPIYPIPQQSPPVYFVRPPAPQMSGIQPYQQQNFQDQPRAREKKIIQIKDPSSNKDVTQEILAGGHSSGTSSSAGGTPSNTPDLSGHSSSSSTPPLISQQQASVRAQFAAQVAATLANDTEHKSSSPASKPGDVMIQKPTGKPVIDNAKVNEVMVLKKDDLLKEAKLSGSNDVDTERQNSEKQSVEPVSESKNDLTEEKVEKEVIVSISTALQSENNIAENTTADTLVIDRKACTSIVHVSELLQEAEPSSLANKETLIREKEVTTTPLESTQEMPSEAVPVKEEKLVNGPVNLSKEEEQDQVTKEEIVVETVSEVESQVVTDVTGEAAVEDASEPVEQCVTEPVTVVEESEKVEVSPLPPETEDGSSVKSVNGHEPESKSAAATKNPVDPQTTGKDSMKKKKQKQRFKDIEKRSLEKEADMMDAYKEKPVKEGEPDDADEGTAEVTEQKAVVEEEPGEAQSEEETWEDKEDNWSQLEGENESGQSEGGKLTYERDFLLQFQYTPVCTLKPAGLPDLEVVLGTARPPPKAGYQGSRMQNTGGGDVFLPLFIRPQQKNQQNPSRGSRRMPPKRVINLGTPPAIDLKRSENRWVRPSELSKTKDEEVQKTEDLFRKVRSILNKLTPQKFQTLTQQILDLDIDTTERLEGVIELIFEKAIDEPGFSVAYANMCRCLISKKVVVEKDGKESAVSFRKILLNRCQKEFEKEKSDERKIHQKLEELSSQGLTEEEIVQRKEELYEEERKGKRRTLGNIRFIGELFKLKMLTENIMHDCVVKLLKSNDEESFECLCKLLVTIGKDLDHEKAKPRVDQYFTQINKIIQARITSSRVRFMMLDIMDLRSNNWVPRREDNNPKTIDQIHKEAADEAKKTQIQIQQASQQKRQRGNMGGRDSPRLQSTAPADDAWTTVSRGGTRVSVDPKKFQNVKQRPVDSENISLGPGGRGYGAWAKGSSGGSGMAGTGAGSSVSAAGEGDSRPSGNRYSPLAGERRGPARQNSTGAGRQEPRSPVSSGNRKGLALASEREKALEAVKATTNSSQSVQTKRTSQERSGGRESPRLTVEAAPTPAAAAAVAASGPPSRPPSGPPSGATSPITELTEEETKKRTVANMNEYLNILDMKEAVECVKDLQSPSTHHVFVSTAFNLLLEKRSSERLATGELIRALLKDRVLTSEQYFKGIQEFFKSAEENDLELDIPHIWEYLGELLSHTAFDGDSHLENLHHLISKFFSKKRNGAKIFAAMFQMAGKLKSPEDIKAIWRRSGLTIYDFFQSKEEAEEFCKDKDIEFALGTPGSSQQPARLHSVTIQEELRTLILKRKARNDEVFDWIDKNVQAPETKSAPFVRALVTAVCEGTLEKDQDGSCKCNSESLKCKKSILQRYIDCNHVLELQALYAVQALFVRLDHPPGFMKSYFDCLYDEEIITEDSYYAWEKSEDPQEQHGKGVARTASSEFFRWLRNASEESGDDN